MIHHQKIAVIIPCYKETSKIIDVLKGIPNYVDSIYVVDDCCPDGTGKFVQENAKDKRITVLTHEHNQGVGGAVVSGYKNAIVDDMDIAVKIDGDGQMDPLLIERFVTPIAIGLADYTKGNRFFRPENVRKMPKARLFGNAVLSFMTKFSSGYWHIFDPTNGYTAIHTKILRCMNLDKLSKGYFFESDMLYRLNITRAVVEDIPMQAVYQDEQSSLHIGKVIPKFLAGHMRNFGRRIFYNYLLRDFSIATLELFLGLALVLFGFIYGLSGWTISLSTGIEASAGTVMLSALPIILGLQFLLSFLQYDIEAVPKTPLQKKL